MKRNSPAQSASRTLHATLRAFLSFAGVVLMLGLATVSTASAARPLVIRSTLITGPDPGVPVDTYPGVIIADLEHGFAAGVTPYFGDGIIHPDTHSPFLWTESDGSAILFKLPDDLVYVESFYISNAMTPDASTVVGGVILDHFTTAPWAWTGRDGVQLLDTPFPFGDTGGAVAVTKDGKVIAGIVGGRSTPGQAAIWKDRNFELLASPQPWSEVGSQFEPEQPFPQHPMTSDGKIIVGASGRASDQMQATRWIDGTEQPLDHGQATSSVAMFVTEGGVIFGTGILPDGRIAILRWDSSGALRTIVAPSGLSVVNLSSIDSKGSAAGGALAQRQSCIGSNDPACNRAPFVWNDPPNGPQNGVFTILPEAGLEKYYNFSTVTDISDQGTAVGTLMAGAQTPGDPPARGFLWRKDTGLVIVNDIIPQIDANYVNAGRVSRDGNRVLVTGNPPQRTHHDTNSLILDLQWPTDH